MFFLPMCAMVIQYLLQTAGGPVVVSHNFALQDGRLEMRELERREIKGEIRELHETTYSTLFSCEAGPGW